jgi:hypothetical protein
VHTIPGMTYKDMEEGTPQVQKRVKHKASNDLYRVEACNPAGKQMCLRIIWAKDRGTSRLTGLLKLLVKDL